MELGKNRLILLVEDNPDDEELTVRALRLSQVVSQVVVARDGEEAVQLLEDKLGDQVPDLVLLDLKLPKLSGLNVLERMREHERLKLTPVVMFTSSSEEQDIRTSYSLGANSYIRKPVDYRQFQETVREIGIYWLTHNTGIA